MSESNGLSILVFLLGLIPGAYFFYRLVREVIYYLKRDDEDIL
jgi:hypothetical protein